MKELRGAAGRGDLEQCKEFITRGYNINWAESNGCTSLMLSSQNNHYHVVKYLLEQKCNVNLRNEFGFSALMVACCNGRKEIATLLISYDADISFTYIQGDKIETAETYAVENDWDWDDLVVKSLLISPLYFEHVFLCAVTEPKIKNINKKRKRKGEEKEMENIVVIAQEKPFMQRFMERVIHSDLLFTYRIMPLLFGPHDPAYDEKVENKG